MPSRDFHHKNRHGCGTCKRRRKRCDGWKPRCGACTRLDLPCGYSPALANTTVLQSMPGASPATQPAPSWNLIDPWHEAVLRWRLPHVEIDDLELAHHYTASTCADFTTIPGLYPLRHLDTIAILARQFPFLLHGILATSALHLRATIPADEASQRSIYEEKATSHQQLALSYYIRTLNIINDETCRFVFAFSVTLAGLGYGFLESQVHKYDKHPKAVINSITKIFDLTIGAVTVANTASGCIAENHPEPFIPPFKPALRVADIPIELEAQEALVRLSSALRELQVDGAEGIPTPQHTNIAMVYEQAIDELHKAFRCLGRAEPDNFCGVLGWPAFVESSYISLLKAHHPYALIVLAYYGVALHSLGHTWWLRGIGRAVVKSVAAMVISTQGNEWQGLLRWAIERTAMPVRNEDQSTSQYPGMALEDQKQAPVPVTPFEVAFTYTYSHDFLKLPDASTSYNTGIAT